MTSCYKKGQILFNGIASLRAGKGKTALGPGELIRAKWLHPLALSQSSSDETSFIAQA